MTAPSTPTPRIDPDRLVFEPTASERELGRLSQAGLDEALDAMREYGFLQIDQALSPTLITRLHQAYSERYLSTTDYRESCLEVGEHRYMITVEVSPPFDDPLVYANPWFFPVVDALL